MNSLNVGVPPASNDKKQGMGKFNWGRPGDEMMWAPVDRRDPNFDEADDYFEWELSKHLKSPIMSPEPSPKDGNKVTWDDDFTLDDAPLESVVVEP